MGDTSQTNLCITTQLTIYGDTIWRVQRVANEKLGELSQLIQTNPRPTVPATPMLIHLPVVGIQPFQSYGIQGDD